MWGDSLFSRKKTRDDSMNFPSYAYFTWRVAQLLRTIIFHYFLVQWHYL